MAIFLFLWVTGFLFLRSMIHSNPDPPVFSNLIGKEVITVNVDFTYQRVIQKKLRVFSKDGLKHANPVIFYDKLNEIRDFELEITDVITGKTLKKARLKDMRDAALSSNTTFFDDNRYKYLELTSSTFPVDVTVRIQTFSKSNFFLPTWVPVPFYNQKVEKSVFQIRYPEELGLKYKDINLPNNPASSQEEGLEILTWTVEDLPVQTADLREDEDYKLILAPVKFALENYEGEMSDWKGLAKWQSELNSGRDELPEEFKSKLKELVAQTEDDYQKIQILYKYLQKNFRYVSIQLGIGGWQTMKASDVLKYAYGDCKGLTNLMKAMLEAVDITSHYTLVYAGKDVKDIQTDFPSNQFNHVILYVPTDKDPIWLECTSSLLPPGYLGEFTKNRHVLVTTPEGGFLTKTPSYSSSEWNTIKTKSKLEIDSMGNSKVNSQIIQKGIFGETILYVKNLNDEREQKEVIGSSFSVSGLIIDQFNVEVSPKDSLLLAEIVLEGYLQRYAQLTSKRLIIRPFFGKITPSKLGNENLHQVDELEIKLPEALALDGPLPMISLDEEYLKGSLSAELKGDRLFLKRELILSIPKDWSQAQKLEFVKKINAAFDQSVFFIKSSPFSSTPN